MRSENSIYFQNTHSTTRGKGRKKEMKGRRNRIAKK
jgi:hypothetical protein